MRKRLCRVLEVGSMGGLLFTGCRVLIWGNEEMEERSCRWVVGKVQCDIQYKCTQCP